jgi:hypothetical protein
MWEIREKVVDLGTTRIKSLLGDDPPSCLLRSSGRSGPDSDDHDPDSPVSPSSNLEVHFNYISPFF